MSVRPLVKRIGVYSDQQTVASGNQWMPDFYRDYEFFKCKGNGHVTSKKECAIMNRVGMTRKQLQRMFLAEGIFTWLLLSVLILTVGTILLCGIGWYMKTEISYFVFSYPIKEMVALLMILLAGSILVPEIFFKKFYGKADTK